MEREEFYRLKKIQDKKKILRAKKAAAEAILKEKGLAREAAEQAKSMLDEAHDEDVLFWSEPIMSYLSEFFFRCSKSCLRELRIIIHRGNKRTSCVEWSSARLHRDLIWP